jgi:hypothetical protein
MDCREVGRERMGDHPYHREGEGLDSPRDALKYWCIGVAEWWSNV